MRGAGLICVFLFGCEGVLDGPRPGPAAPAPESATTAIPRLSRREVEASVVSVFGIRGAALRNLPEDPLTAVNPTTLAEEEVFDTLTASKQPTQVFVEGLENLAFEVARDFAADAGAVGTLSGCTPSGPGVDVACLSSLIERLALRLWRRPITPVERDELLAVATPLGTHQLAVRAVVGGLLQSPEFVYRSELGASGAESTGELVQRRLTDLELVSRLAAFLWGDAPSADLLNSVLTNPLDDAALVSLVDAMLDDARAKEQMRAFHRLWLRYPSLLVADPALAADLRAESDALVDRALFTPGTAWTTLFSSAQTFVSPRLATHYGLPAVGSAGWVNVDAPRAGLLSHGSFLSLSSTRLTDTLPSRRGAMIARRVLCLTILPPPKDVNIDDGVEVAPGACKTEAYEAHRSNGSCAGCHAVIDGLGFGFEQLDGQGRLRPVEPGNASCTIAAEGRFLGQAFSGPRDLVSRFEPQLERCAVSQLTRFAFREREVSTELAERFQSQFTASGGDFRALMRAIALDPRFRVRVAEAEVSP